jgi:hypothetical protein
VSQDFKSVGSEQSDCAFEQNTILKDSA